MRDERDKPAGQPDEHSTDREVPADVSPAEAARWEALARQLTGEGSSEDARIVADWMAQDPAEARAIYALNAATASLPLDLPRPLDIAGALERVRYRRHAEQHRAFSPALRAAALILVLAGGAAFWRLAERSRRVEPQRFSTAAGQRDTVRLPDGSEVILAAGSMLEVAAGYGEEQRAVRLQGEAMFSVHHEAAHPFLVRAGNAAVHDIGTRFVVQADSSSGVRVTVAEGSVLLHESTHENGARVTGADSGVVLAAGDRGVLRPDGQLVAQRGIGVDVDFAWTRGELVFRDADLNEVSATLWRWFGVEVRVRDAGLAGRHVTATFRGESLDEVLRVISLALGARVERRADTVDLREAVR